MNLVTMTFDADEWQVVPKKATAEMRDGLRTGFRRDCPSDELCNVRWAAALGKAPQPHSATRPEVEAALQELTDLGQELFPEEYATQPPAVSAGLGTGGPR